MEFIVVFFVYFMTADGGMTVLPSPFYDPKECKEAAQEVNQRENNVIAADCIVQTQRFLKR